MCIRDRDGVSRGLVGDVLLRVERKGYRIEQIKSLTMDRDLAGRHYAEHEGEPFYDKLIDYITEGPVVVAIISGENSIENLRKIMGATDPLDATAGSIRGAYATSVTPVSYTHLRAHETRHDLVCRLLLEKKKNKT